jgi:hypothetical protein
VSIVLFVDGIFQVSAKYLQVRNGVYFYYRRIPEELRGHYNNKRHRLVSLQTKHAHIAAKKAAKEARADDAAWRALRTPGSTFTTQEVKEGGAALLHSLGMRPGEAREEPERVNDNETPGLVI